MLRLQKIIFFFFLTILVFLVINLTTQAISGNLTFDLRWVLGLILPLVIVITSSYSYSIIKKVEFLKTKGKKVDAQVTEVKQTENFLLGKRYQVVCEWVNPEDNVRHKFVSYKFALPVGYSLDQTGAVDVYVDQSYQKYFVEPKKLIN
jgi:hypothetical protein